MADLQFAALVLAAVLGLVLLVVLLVRRPRVALPPEMLSQLARMESAQQAMAVAIAKNDGALDAIAQQVQGIAYSTAASVDTIRKAVDEKLTETIAESRGGRKEALDAFGLFESKLEQRLSLVDTLMAQRFESLQTASLSALENSRKTVDEKLALSHAQALAGRKELLDVLTIFRAELGATVAKLAEETLLSRSAFVEGAAAMDVQIQTRFETLTASTRQTLDSLKLDINGQLGVMSATMSTALKDQLEGNGGQIRNQFAVLQDAVSQQLSALSQGSQQNAEQLRTALNERLAAIQADNTAKLEEMRRTVDEKLHATLEQRLGESFKLVSERLEQVHKGLGEMQTLATGVGDLKHLLSDVKTRGIFGEAQLAALLEQVLTVDQYAAQVMVRPGSNQRVDFAVKFPGKSHDGEPLWLPIDAKFPNEDYERLLDAQQRAHADDAKSAGNALDARIRAEAKSIASKYIAPPHTTEFAILFLPSEGLYAEVLRRPGLMDFLSREHRVVLAGPTTLLSILSSFQMGFRTLAIEKRSSEVWQILGSVKSEFLKFGKIVEDTQKSIEAAAKKFSDVGVRTRAIQRSLRDVQDDPTLAVGSAPLVALPPALESE